MCGGEWGKCAEWASLVKVSFQEVGGEVQSECIDGKAMLLLSLPGCEGTCRNGGWSLLGAFVAACLWGVAGGTWGVAF